MSRSPEEQQLLEQRIEAMKRKNEELRRRHLEVEADKQSAAKQNALVQIKSPFDDEWIPGGRHERLEQERSAIPSSPLSQEHQKVQRSDHPRVHQNDGQYESTSNISHHGRENERQFRDSSNRNLNEESHFRGKHTPNHGNAFNRGQRSDFPNRRPNNVERGHSEDNRRPREPSGYYKDSQKNRHRDFGGDNRPWPNQARVEESHVGSAPSVTSKVFKNSSIDGDKGWKPKSRLAEGDGPPADPHYSFLGDDARDSDEVIERRQGFSNRRGSPRGQGYNRGGGRPWNNRRYGDSRESAESDHGHTRSPKSGENYEAWRRERNKIDEDRINRQKMSDGNWSREWDNNKLYQEERDRPFVKRGSRGLRQQHGNRGSSEIPSGVAQMRMNRMREGHFPGDQNFSDYSVPFPPPCHDHIRRGRFGPRRGRDHSSRDLPSQENKSEPSQDNTPPQEQRRLKTKRERSSKVSNKSVVSESKDNEEGSWEDVSSTEENISEVSEMIKSSKGESSSSKAADVSSGPESLDPIPTPGKEDGFLWDDYHTGGFQENLTVTVDLNAEEVCKAYFEKKIQEGDDGEACPQVPTFRLDTHCLEDSDGDDSHSKLDPLLVTTQIVQAEVEKMSLPSIPSDESHSCPMDKAVQENDTEVPEKSPPAATACPESSVSAEELSGPVSILELHSPQHVSSDSEVSFQSVESPSSPSKETFGVDESNTEDPDTCSKSNSSSEQGSKSGSSEANNEVKSDNLSCTDQAETGFVDCVLNESTTEGISVPSNQELISKEPSGNKEDSYHEVPSSLLKSQAVPDATQPNDCSEGDVVQPETLSPLNVETAVNPESVELTMSEDVIAKLESLTETDVMMTSDKGPLITTVEVDTSVGELSKEVNIPSVSGLNESNSKENKMVPPASDLDNTASLEVTQPSADSVQLKPSKDVSVEGIGNSKSGGSTETYNLCMPSVAEEGTSALSLNAAIKVEPVVQESSKEADVNSEVTSVENPKGDGLLLPPTTFNGVGTNLEDQKKETEASLDDNSTKANDVNSLKAEISVDNL